MDIIKENIIKEIYFILSATAPETIVAAVPQKTSWKKNFARRGTPAQDMEEYTPLYASPVAGELSGPERKNNPFKPTKGVPSPNINPHPRMRYPKEDMAKTIKFLERIFTVFFTRANPDSTIAKPKFMKNTSIPVNKTQIVSRITLFSISFTSKFLDFGKVLNF
ncbi:hypothetical protein DICTH_0176 [Dictyoglomus thermophilum H-6-12]|uniref:Uncharacterized protein n=1 Tax=Dictyoglomus thermophilum (strain ATCC 35947 / DSM 3960 / H-6-12) TaxID=309799 RepID=B5YBJ3_DICT6|nr:hypothetical protein DICTH_0176 [Dictyoglomus thermophilum H-6-12]